MKHQAFFRYAITCILMLLSGAWAAYSAAGQLWISTSISLLFFCFLMSINYFSLEKNFKRRREQHTTRPESSSVISPTREQFYELVLRQVATGVVSCNKQGKVEWMNRAAEDQLGFIAHIDAEWLNEKAGSERVIQLHRHNHHRECLLTRIYYKEGENHKILFTLRDIRHVLEAKQQESWKSLSRVLTHEIMNSMTPILSLADTMVERANTEETAHIKRGLETIRRRGKSLLDFVNNYRKMTRIPTPQPEDIDADEFFRHLRGLFPQPFIVFEQPYKDFCIRADRTQLEQVLINLIKNAMEAEKSAESPIEVSLSRNLEHHKVCIHVQDHGQGIASAELNNIFMPFYTTKANGSGIGLSLCQQIIGNHGGDIRVHSVADHGSCFTVCLPMAH